MNKIKNRRLALRAYKIRVKQYPYDKPLMIETISLLSVRKMTGTDVIVSGIGLTIGIQDLFN